MSKRVQKNEALRLLTTCMQKCIASKEAIMIVNVEYGYKDPPIGEYLVSMPKPDGHTKITIELDCYDETSEGYYK